MADTPDNAQTSDLSAALDSLFDFDRELEGLVSVTLPGAADSMAEAFERASDRIEQALNRAAKTGEISFESMVTAILADLARLAAGAAMDQILSGLGGAVSAAPVSVNVTMPSGSDAASLVAAQGQIAAALTQALSQGARWT